MVLYLVLCVSMYRLEQGPAGPKYIARKTFMLEIAIHLCVCVCVCVGVIPVTNGNSHRQKGCSGNQSNRLQGRPLNHADQNQC